MNIHKLELRNFKRIKEETFHFNQFDLIVGANNSGKSTALQALAIWQYCLDMFRLSPRTGSSGIQVVLPNFTALPLPEFNLLWTDRIDREYHDDASKPSGKAQMYVLIEVDLYWTGKDGEEKHFCIQMRYHSPQAVYAIPKEGWKSFKTLIATEEMPRIVYVPPFSGLEPNEKWMDDGNMREQVGKAQPGSVLRNLLYRVIDRKDVQLKDNTDWQEIHLRMKDWFGVDLLMPDYTKAVSTKISVEFKHGKKYDIIAGGSGFHQILTIMAFLYGYPGLTCILFDEPDAHLHVNLQRKVINYFKARKDVQFLIATHSEEFVKNVEIGSVISIHSGKPKRVTDVGPVLAAMSDVDNMDVIRTQTWPLILYVEGEDDERILSAWADTLGMREVYDRFYPYILGGSTKAEMKAWSDRHYTALKEVVPDVSRVLLLDYDGDDVAINPPTNQQTLNEWKRKNIDNYLLVPDAWKRAAEREMKEPVGSLFLTPLLKDIDDYFASQNLNLPPGGMWRTVNAEIFKVVDGKKLLFERHDALYHQMKDTVRLNRSAVAQVMTVDEIHDDVHAFFSNLKKVHDSKKIRDGR